MARSNLQESGFQDEVRKKLNKLFPGCMIFKMTQLQGVPDLLILYNNKWASLECKKTATANHQPNQDYYVDRMNKMSFSRFINPKNVDEVLYELSQTFRSY